MLKKLITIQEVHNERTKEDGRIDKRHDERQTERTTQFEI